MKDKFYELSITSSNLYQEILELIFSFGFTCIEERQDEIILRDEEDLNDVAWGINEYAKRFCDAKNLQNDVKISLTQKPNKDWIDEYKRSVRPVLIDKVYIHPSWEEPKQDLINIVIDPALAFGSGHHESTNSCIYFLQKYAKNHNLALDVGCGSGILSIVLAKLGCVVDACDTDIQATQSTAVNSNLNDIKLNNIWTGSISNLSNKYDIVVANIIADVIFMLKKELINSVKIGGYLILSGILNKYQERVKQEFALLNLIEQKELNEWTSFVFKK